MVAANNPFVSFNGGEIGKEIISRTQIDSYGSTASLLENILPEAAGPMSKRPGLGFLVELGRDTKLKRFVFGIGQKYLMAFSDNAMRIIQNGGVIVRPSVSCTIVNGAFNSPIGTGWVESSDTPGIATITGSQLILASDGTNRAAAKQQVTTASPNVVHALSIVVSYGPVTFRVGSTDGGDDYIVTTSLRKGVHSLAFTPTGTTFWVEALSNTPYVARLDSCTIAAAGDMVIATPWLISQFNSLRFQQSKDVIYVNGPPGTGPTRRIERRSSSSWSLVYTDEQDGPFLSPNLDDSIVMSVSSTFGNMTMGCNRNYFKPGHVGALFQLTHQGQRQCRTVVANEGSQFTDPIKVTGIGADRDFSYTVAGTFTGTIRVQRSYQDDSNFTNAGVGFTGETATAPGTTDVDEDTSSGSINNNVTIYYRLGVSDGDLTAGSANVSLISTRIGKQTGIVRVTGYISPTSVFVEVLSQLGNVGGTSDWVEGAWSDVQGHPRAVSLFDDRLWRGALDLYWASQSSLYETMETGSNDGDAIWRNISAGDVGQIQWILALSRVVFGTDVAEDIVRSSAFDDPITPTNLTVRDVSSWGSADIEPEKIDSRGLFVDRSGIHLMELAYSSDIQDYVARPLTRLNKNIGRPGLGQISISRRPETRLFACRTDGNCLIKLYDPGENVLGWSHLTTPMGQITSVESLPGTVGTGQDEDYFITMRRINGVNHFYLEKLGPIYNATAADGCCLDAYIRQDQNVCNAVTFNGSSYVHRNAGFTSDADGKKGVISFWMNIQGDDAGQQPIYASSGAFFTVYRLTDGRLRLTARNAAGTIILQMTSANTYTSANGWIFAAFAWDLTVPIGRFYIADQDQLAETGTAAIAVNDTIDYTRTDHIIGFNGSTYFVGDLAEFFFSDTAYLDISVTSNREKLISSTRYPVELGANGNGPTGAQPRVYLGNAASTFQTNIGSGGNFTVVGFIDDAVPPNPRVAAQSKIISGLSHLEGQQVMAWVDGIDMGPYTVASGQITLPLQPAQACVGLEYLGKYQSSRLAFQAQAGTAQGQQQQMQQISLIFLRSSKSVIYGPSFDEGDDMAARGLLAIETDNEGGLVTGISEPVSVPGGMNRDPRLCLTMYGGGPVTLAGYILGSKIVEHVG